MIAAHPVVAHLRTLRYNNASFGRRQMVARRARTEKDRETDRLYRESHREEAKLKAKRWREAHPEQRKEIERSYKRRHAAKIAEQKRIWRKNNVEKHNAANQRWKINRAMKQCDFHALLAEQNGGCAICGHEYGSQAKDRRLCIDHCHTTQVVRGLLCGHCNRMLGLAKDDPTILRRAAAYLERSR